jgi:hypothetical protein
MKKNISSYYYFISFLISVYIAYKIFIYNNIFTIIIEDKMFDVIYFRLSMIFYTLGYIFYSYLTLYLLPKKERNIIPNEKDRKITERMGRIIPLILIFYIGGLLIFLGSFNYVKITIYQKLILSFVILLIQITAFLNCENFTINSIYISLSLSLCLKAFYCNHKGFIMY